MRATWLVLTVGAVCLSLSGRGMAAEPDGPAALADRIFGNADKNKDSSLDSKEVLEAKRIFKAAIFQGKKADELPGGKKSFDRIEEAATKGKLDDNKSGNVTKSEWLDHVKDSFAKKEAILKDAREKAAQAKKANQDREKLEAAQRQNELLKKKIQQDKKKDNKKPGKK